MKPCNDSKLPEQILSKSASEKIRQLIPGMRIGVPLQLYPRAARSEPRLKEFIAGRDESGCAILCKDGDEPACTPSKIEVKVLDRHAPTADRKDVGCTRCLRDSVLPA